MTLHRTTRLLLAGTVAAGLLAGCSSDGSDAAPTTTTAAATSAPGATTETTTTVAAGPTTTVASTTTATTSPPCTSGAAEPPAGAATREIADVDGDATPDQVWIAQAEDGSVEVGITTAAGGGATAPFDSASPVRRSVLVVDADDQGPIELFFDDGRLVQLHAFVDCRIVPVTNPEGETYTFGLGFTDVGTGIGCVDTDEGRRLVGLDVDEEAAEGDTVGWSRTIVELDGTEASNGPVETGTYTRPEDDAAIELLRAVTCGDLTMADDGVTAPQP